MGLTRAGVAVAALIGLTACQSVNGMRINGVDIHPAQGETFCERNIAMCLLGGAAVAGGVALAAMGHGYSRNGSTMGGAGY
jgi:hypothetical protein